MKILRILLGISLILIVSSMNGFRGYMYLFGAQFEIAFKGDYESDPRYSVTKDDEGATHVTIANEEAHLSLLSESKFWLFGWVLLGLSLLQFIGGFFLLFRSQAGTKLAAFLFLAVILGLTVETIEGIHKFTFGTMNWVGVFSSFFLMLVTLKMIGSTQDRAPTTL